MLCSVELSITSRPELFGLICRGSYEEHLYEIIIHLAEMTFKDLIYF